MSNNASHEPVAREEQIGPLPAPTPAQQHIYPGTAGFSNHSHPSPEGAVESRVSPAASGHPLPHGYNHAQLPQHEVHLHPELRSHETAPSPGYAPPPAMIQAGVAHPPDQVPIMSGPPAGMAQPVGVIDHGEGGADGRKKRELSQSKRAAQNRAAQRAFRQRKEGYIKKLEQQVKDFEQMSANYQALQQEAYALREYAGRLQARQLELTGECPPPPPGLSLGLPPPRGPLEQQQPQPVQQTPANALEVAAQAVAGLNRSEHLASRGQPQAQPPQTQVADPYASLHAAVRSEEDARTVEEITRQLQADGVAHPDGLPAVDV